MRKNKVADPWGGDEWAGGKDENRFVEEAELRIVD